jgi:hypothetical protein
MNPTERIAEIITERKQRCEPTGTRRRAHRRGREIDEAVRQARKLSPRFADESDHDHAKRLGLLGEPHNRDSLFGCAWCSGLSHRRPERGTCRGCGERFAPEMIERVIPDIQSSAGAMVDVGGTGHIGLRGSKPHARNRKNRAA